LNAYVNRQVEDAYRATVISIISLAGSLSFALVSPMIGLSLDEYGPLTTYLAVGITMTVGTLGLMWRRQVK
ncbi:MAG: MFS transporter, partial [Gemmatimonadota bacterium]|nr:MFS transporter [Gemmatimonadota bacterium]